MGKGMKERAEAHLAIFWWYCMPDVVGHPIPHSCFLGVKDDSGGAGEV